LAKKKRSRKSNFTYIRSLVTLRQPKSPASEAFRTLRTNIDFSSFDKEIKTLMITSAVPGEGKSTTAVNLGIAMAVTGKRVLVIDADLRDPTQHRFFDFDNRVGLTSLMINEELQLVNVVRKTEVNAFFVLTSGPIPPNPAEILTSQKMRKFVAGLTEVFDMVIVDSPPVTAVSDASILASYLDGVVLVVGSGAVAREVVLRARDQLQKVKANILGVVLNKVPANGSGYYYSYYYGTARARS
jgi:capsular exopolysaccharide synthesis family protein